MGKVQQRAGGGKATVENLAAENLKSGVTVTVKQGSKTVQQVTGSLKVKRISVNSSNGNVDMKTLLPNAWKQLTIENFAYSSCSASCGLWTVEAAMNWASLSVSTSMSYNETTGILTISGSTSASYSSSANHGFNMGNARSIVCYYCE